MTETTRLLRDLVALPSVNPMGRDLVGREVYEHRVSDYLESFFSSLGVPYQRQCVVPERDNMIAWYDPPSGPPTTLVFEAHQDTVPTDGMTIQPFAAHIEEGRLYGRGACDVKGGMAAMLTAFARVVRERPAGVGRLVMACTVDEEFTFLGVRRLVKDDLRGGRSGRIEAVVAEPTELNIVNAHKGAVRWDLLTAGRSCHSSRPERGVNAIYRMARLLAHVEKYAKDLRATQTHPLLGPATLSVGRIEGGVSVNTVPDHCRVEIDRRLLPGEDSDAAAADLAEYLHQQIADIPFSFGDPWLSAPALSPQGSEGLVKRLGAAIEKVVGRREVQAVPYGTDAAPLAAAGVPSVVFGPGDIGKAHTCDESVPLEEVEQAAEILFRLACDGGGV
jgi:acetylornithine deacetylase